MNPALNPLVPGADDDLTANRRGVLSAAQENELGHLLTRQRRAAKSDVRDAVASRFVERLVTDLAGSSVTQLSGRVAWVGPSTPGMPLWVTRPGYVAFLENETEPVPLLGAAMPGSYVMYALPHSRAVVGLDAPGVERRAPSQRHRSAYAELLGARPPAAPSWAPAAVALALTVVATLPLLGVWISPESAGTLQAGVPWLDATATRAAVPAVLALITGALAARRMAWRPREVQGVSAVRWTATSAGRHPMPYLQPAELLWTSPARFDVHISLDGVALPDPGPLAAAVVPGAAHRALLDPRDGRLLQLTPLG